MRRPWRVWLACGLSLLLLAAAVAWVSGTVLRLDLAEREARRRADLEERVRLALWRMDSALASLVAAESARPYFLYRPYYSADRPYASLFSPLGSGDTVVASSLLSFESPYIRLHFQVDPRGRWTSPQVPSGSTDAGQTTAVNADKGRADKGGLLAQLEQRVEVASFLKQLAPEGPTAGPVRAGVTVAARPRTTPAEPPTGKGLPRPQQIEQQQTLLNQQEFQARVQNFQQNALQQQAYLPPPPSPPGLVEQGALKPVWHDGQLLLARRVEVNGQSYVQGCWLDWTTVRRWLLGSVSDLLPDASLEPATDTDPRHRLAALPARLIPGPVDEEAPGGLSPLQVSLAVAWACVLVAVAAVLVLLRGALVLGERRAAFVSAVTHELRTPLTTLRMYSEMLAGDMLPSEEKRRQYLATLSAEADRLGHLVENVLAYSRLERGRAEAHVIELSLGDLLDRLEDRLARHAAGAGLLWTPGVGPLERQTRLRTDPTAIEQVLFNLVDNACKYAAGASDRRLHLEAERSASRLVLRLRDHGPGISAREAQRLFRPFAKSARDAANSAPGVGLGLALSRRLARRLGGDLTVEPGAEGGARFALTLPVLPG